MTRQTPGFGRQLLAALTDPTGRDAEIERLQGELARQTERADRYRERHDAAARELSDARATLMKVKTVKCWRNEDGHRFVFVSDLQAALGVPTDTGQE